MRVFPLLLTAAGLMAQGAGNPATRREWVDDQAKMLTEPEQGRLRKLLSRIYTRTGAQMVLLTVPRVGEGGTRDYTTRQFNAWKLGSAEKNDGVLILVSQHQRAVEIVIGSGLPKTLPHFVLDGAIQGRIIPAIQAGNVAEGLAEGIKDIGARLAGFDRAEKPPVTVFAILAALGAALGATALFRLWAYRRRPLQLPADGCVPAAEHYQGKTFRNEWFREDKPQKFYIWQSERLPFGLGTYPPLWRWCAAVGLSLAGAGVAALGVSLLAMGLEPSFALLWFLIGITCPIAFAGLGSANTGEFDGVPIVAPIIGAVCGVVPAYFGNLYFWSDFAVATYVAGGAAFVVNALFGGYIANNFYGWEPSRFVCEACGAPVRDLTKEELAKLRPSWDARLPRTTLVDYRGWRCSGQCSGAYLAYSARQEETVCPKCATPTVETANDGEYRVRTCLLCDHTEKEKLPEPRKQMAGAAFDSPSSSSSYEPAASTTSSSYDDQWQRDTSSSSYDNTPSSGGSSDGDGASGNW